ncbi:unnamed protein product, partial [marine sediment metagenome]
AEFALEAQLIDGNLLTQCENSMQGGRAALAAFLEENANTALAALISCNLPGKGGINRGRGDAAMTWTEGTSEEGAGFKEKTLSPAALADLKKSKLLGISTGAPQESEGGTVNVSGIVSGAAAGGGSAHRHLVLPKHKRTVRSYFERKK